MNPNLAQIYVSLAFQFAGKPFKVTTDPGFLWVGEKHKTILEASRYGILHGDGYVVLTGDVGTGKTTLAMALAKDLSETSSSQPLPIPTLRFSKEALKFTMKRREKRAEKQST